MSGHDEELVEVLDEHGTVLDVVPRSQMRSGRLRHRCTFVVVRNPLNEVLVHRRSSAKDLWPDRWDLAVGGVVQAGEEWEAAAARELAEEVGIVGVGLRPLVPAEVSYDDGDVSEVARVWSAEWDGPVVFADGEVVEARWESLADLVHMVQRSSFVPDSVALVLPLVLADGCS